MASIRVKPIEKIVSKYASRAAVAGPAYVDGIEFPKRPQAESAIASFETYRAGVQASLDQKRYVKGLQKAGSEKWARKSREVGANRYGPGVAAAKGDFQAGFEPFRAALEAIELAPRLPKGDPQNNARSAAVGARLRAVKLSL